MYDLSLTSSTSLIKNGLVYLLVRFSFFLVTPNDDLQVKVVFISCGRDLEDDLSDFPSVEVLR